MKSSSDDLVEVLFVKSGLNHETKQIPLFIQQELALQKRRESLSIETYRKQISLVKKIYSPESIRKIILDHLRENLDRNTIHAALNWLNSPLGEKISLLENSAQTPEGNKEISKYLRQPTKHTATRSRLLQLQRLDQAVHTTESLVDNKISIQLIALSILSETHARLKPSTLKLITENIEKKRPLIRDKLSKNVLAIYMYTYRDLQDSELEKYILFSESEAGTKYFTAYYGAVKSALLISKKRLFRSKAYVNH
ncbi:MAG TPA: hypothetical protein ENH23_07630 [candidate division Zixibacteria bacterium]|nr:hypothetical protein [candidate division Zixibacteria bacterium]